MEVCAREGLNASEGIRPLVSDFKATAGNDRFHTYTFQQRIGALDRLVPQCFVRISGTIASVPGASSTIPRAANRATRTVPPGARTRRTGFDWCPGDDVLLNYKSARRGYVGSSLRRQDA